MPTSLNKTETLTFLGWLIDLCSLLKNRQKNNNKDTTNKYIGISILWYIFQSGHTLLQDHKSNALHTYRERQKLNLLKIKQE